MMHITRVTSGGCVVTLRRVGRPHALVQNSRSSWDGRLRHRGGNSVYTVRLHGADGHTTHVHGLVSRPGTELGEWGGGAMRRWLAAKHRNQLMPTRGVRAILGGNTHGCSLRSEREREKERRSPSFLCVARGARRVIPRKKGGDCEKSGT